MSYVNSRVVLNLPRQPQVEDVDTYKELLTLYNSLQIFHAQVSKYLGVSGLTAAQLVSDGVSESSRVGELNVGTVVITEAVAVGDLINIYTAPAAKGRLASKAAATRRPAHCIALDAGVSGATIRVCYGGYVKAGSFTAGAPLYLSTAGGFSTANTQVVGECSQQVGVAVSADYAILYPAQPFRVYAYNPQSTATGGLLQDESGAVLYASGPISGVTKYYEPVLVPM